jgi:AcrR family transcriptional regulator
MSPELSTEPPLGLRERSRRERIANITRVARQLFAERGFNNVTTKEIAQKANVGEATLFRMVGSKFELLMWVISDRVQAVVDEIEVDDARAPRTDGRSYLDRVYGAYRRRSALFQEDPDNTRALVLEGFASDSTLRESAISPGDRTIVLVERIVEDGQRAGVLQAGVDPHVVALNCNGFYVHEVCRSPARGFPVETFGDRVQQRLEAQLEPLLLDAS